MEQIKKQTCVKYPKSYEMCLGVMVSRWAADRTRQRGDRLRPDERQIVGIIASGHVMHSASRN